MLKLTRLLAGICLVLLIGLAHKSAAAEDQVIKPQKMSKAEIAGEIFSRPEMIAAEHPGGPTYDVVSLLSSDEKFVSGMYQAGASRSEINEPYGVDEFMYFLEGSVTLTSSDGSIQIISAGEAATIPKEWTGIWETEGYTKIYVIYSATGEIE
jgi:uncharacterized cupin superfamily protein